MCMCDLNEVRPAAIAGGVVVVVCMLTLVHAACACCHTQLSNSKNAVWIRGPAPCSMGSLDGIPYLLPGTEIMRS